MENRIESMVIGLGEVGSALKEILSEHGEVIGIDIEVVASKRCEYMNICIPYSESFVEVVNEYITKFGPTLTIIHSSVPVGTTKKIYGPVVHSPVRGKHPQIKEGLKDYVKFIGYDSVLSGDMAYQYLSKYFQVELIEGTETTELMKIASLATYGVYLEMAREVEGYFVSIGKDSSPMKRWWETQNEHIGKYYSSMQMPVIEPPKGVIGGHCVMPVTELLLEDKRFNSELPFVAYSRSKVCGKTKVD